jgi:hypothetical protein
MLKGEHQDPEASVIRKGFAQGNNVHALAFDRYLTVNRATSDRCDPFRSGIWRCADF